MTADRQRQMPPVVESKAFCACPRLIEDFRTLRQTPVHHSQAGETRCRRAMASGLARLPNRTIKNSETTMQPKLLCKVFGIEPRRLALAAACLGLAWLGSGQMSQAANEQQA